MNDKSLNLWAAVLLLVGGLVHLIPGLYNGLASLTDDFPWVQIVIGLLSVIVALVLFAGEKPEEEGEDKAPVSEAGSSSEPSRSEESGGGSDRPIPPSTPGV